MRVITAGATPIVAAEAFVFGVDQSPRQYRSSTVMLSAAPLQARSPVQTLEFSERYRAQIAAGDLYYPYVEYPYIECKRSTNKPVRGIVSVEVAR